MREDLKMYCKHLIFEGFDVQFKDIVLTDLRNHLPHSMNHSRTYQVHAPGFSELFKNLNDAVDTFGQLVKQKKGDTSS